MSNTVDVEKTIEFILSHQANAEVQMEKFREGMAELRAAQAAALAAEAARAEAHAAALTAQAEAQTASLAEQAEVSAKNFAQHDRVMARIDARLDHAIRLSVQDARAQRKRHQEFDQMITRLAAAQLVTEEKMQVTEEKLQRFIDSMKRGTNGHT